MKAQFDKIINRSQNFERKWDESYLKEHYNCKNSNINNASIADLDFKTPKAIRKAIIKRAKKWTYSYTYDTNEFYNSIIYWYETQHQIILNKNNIKLAHGTVNALFQLVLAFSNENDAVLIQTPVYGPFGRAIFGNKRKVVTNSLKWIDNRYQIDFINFETVIKNEKPKIFILCNPHNPGGIVWKTNDLKNIVEICNRYKVLIISDEVHSDLILPEYQFTSLLSLNIPNNKLIVCNSPNKAFNLGGLKTSFLITFSSEIMNQIKLQYQNSSITSPNIFAQPAIISAYQSSKVKLWKKQMLIYIKENYQYLLQNININGLKIMNLEASFLVWFDYEETNLSPEKFQKQLQKNQLIVAQQEDFVHATPYQFRLNIGCPKKQLKKLITIINKVFAD